MKNFRIKPRSFTDLLLSHIESEVNSANKAALSSVDHFTAINDSLRHYRLALEESKELVRHFERMISLLEDNNTLPF